MQIALFAGGKADKLFRLLSKVRLTLELQG